MMASKEDANDRHDDSCQGTSGGTAAKGLAPFTIIPRDVQWGAFFQRSAKGDWCDDGGELRVHDGSEE